MNLKKLLSGSLAAMLAASGIAQAATQTLTLGTSTGPGGVIVLNGSTSGSATIQTPAAAGTGTVFQLPPDNGTNGYSLKTNGSGITSWTAAGTGDALLGTSQAWTAGQAVTPSALTDGATITPDASLSNGFTVTLGGNRTLANPTNLKTGQFLEFAITQDGTGSRTLAYGSQYKFVGGTAPTLTTTAAAVDVLSCWANTSSRLNCQILLDVR